MLYKSMVKAKSFFEANMIKDYLSEKMSKITQKEKKFLMSRIKEKNTEILEIMCGYGRLCSVLNDEGFNVKGTDISHFDFIPHTKNFNFIREDFFEFSESTKYKYIYSLYNSYESLDFFLKVVNKAEKIIEKNGIFIIDVFNFNWRTKFEKNSSKTLYDENNFKVIIKRTFDKNKKIETTKYNIENHPLKKQYKLSQYFFSEDELIESLNEKWIVNISNSLVEGTREDDQKIILELRKR